MATKTIGCLRDLGVGLQLDENGMLIGLDDPALDVLPDAGLGTDAMSSGSAGMGGMWGMGATTSQAPKRPATPPTTALGSYGFDEQESAVTLGCIRDLFTTNWGGQGGQNTSADEDMTDFLGALQEALPDGDGKGQDLASTMMALTNGTSTMRKPGLASLFGPLDDDDDAPLGIAGGVKATALPPAFAVGGVGVAAPSAVGVLPVQLVAPQNLVAPLAAAAPVAAPPAVQPAAATKNTMEHPPPPCAHNNWDNVRVKRGFFGLRCRDCSSNWKVPIKLVVKCPAFFNGYCPHGAICPLPHIHRYKNPEKEREKAKGLLGAQGRMPGDMGNAVGRTESGFDSQASGVDSVGNPLLDGPDDESAHMGGLTGGALAANHVVAAMSPLVTAAPVLAVGVVVHVAPDGYEAAANLEGFARLGGMGVVVEPGYDAATQAWSVRTRDGQVFAVAAPRIHAVPTARLDRNANTTPQEKLEATFAVPLSVYGLACDGGDGTNAPHTLPADKEEFLQKLVAEKLSDPVFNAVMAGRPCEHNNWDNVRIVKGKIGLRCRLCTTHWKVEVSVIVKCPAFFNGYCPNGVGCPLPHIHRYKNKAKEAAKARLVMTMQHGGGAQGMPTETPGHPASS